MELSIESQGSLKRAITGHILAADIDSRVDARLREMAPKMQVRGFRPGKVPLHLVRARYATEIRREIVGELISEALSKTMQEQNLDPVANPDITEVTGIEKGDLKFVATIEVLPDLSALDLDGLGIERVESTVEEADIDRMIETLREQRAEHVEVEAVATADVVLLKAALLLDGADAAAERKPLVVAAGRGQGGADLDAALLSLGVGAEIDVQASFDGSVAEDFRMRGGRLVAEIERIIRRRLPEVDGEFAQGFGIADGSLDTLRSDVRRNLERELGNALRARLKEQVFEALATRFDGLEVPAALKRQEVQRLAENAYQRMAQAQGGKADRPDPALFESAAERSARVGMVVDSVVRGQKMQPEHVRVEQRLVEIASTYEDPQAVLKAYAGNERAMKAIRDQVLEDQVVEWLAERAAVTTRTLDFTAALRRESN